MKIQRTLFLFGLSILTFACDHKKPIDMPTPKPEESQNDFEIRKKLSEAFGNKIISENKKLPPEYHYKTESLITGIKNGVSGAPAPLPEKEFQKMNAVYQEKVIEVVKSIKMKEADKLFEEHTSQAGVVNIIPNKLQYKVLKTGNGAEVLPDQQPIVNLKAKRADGTDLPINQGSGGKITSKPMIAFPGLPLAIPGMKEGEIREIYIHPEIINSWTKGDSFFDPVIFEVEIVKADSNFEKLNTLILKDEVDPD